MTPQEIKIKFQLRLNKVSSSDYSNIQDWQIREAFNKGQLEWCRRQIHGINQKKEGDESSKMRVDDLNILLNDPPLSLSFTEKDKYVITETLPSNYAWFKKLSIEIEKGNCKKSTIYAYFIEEADSEWWLSDENKKPSFEFGETFFTIVDNKIKVYTNNEFEVKKIYLIYYRQPININFNGCDNIDGTVGTDVSCEFKQDVAELLVDEGVEIMKIDLELSNIQLSSARKELNN